MAEQGFEYDQYAPQAGGRLFSSAMFGFNKQEVLEYLDELTDEQYRRQEEDEQRIGELNELAESLRTQIDELQQGRTPLFFEGEGAAAPQGEELEIARAATQQAEEELAELREQMAALQQETEWYRAEYPKADVLITDLQRQLEAATGGQWEDYAKSEERLAECNRQIEEYQSRLAQQDMVAGGTQKELEERDRQLAELRAQLEAARAEVEKLRHDPEAAARDSIIADATAEAERIRAVARDEKERIRRQIRTSASGIAESITNLRSDVSGVEDDVTTVLESVQNSLAEILSALTRTEQNLNTFGVQVERFPAASAPVPKPPPRQQLVYFQPSAQPVAEPRRKVRAAAVESIGTAGFRRVLPDADDGKQGDKLRPFRAAYSNSAPAKPAYYSQGAEAYEAEPQDDRLRQLAETLVDTLAQMMN